MSENINIFEDAKPQGGEFFKFKKVGDSIQGTYIDAHDAVDSYGNEQTIYVLLDTNNKVWNLGFRKTATVIHERMKGIRLGQIVGFRFDEERDSKRNPGTKAHIIRIYADPKLIDTEWLEEQKRIEAKWNSLATKKDQIASQSYVPTGSINENNNAFNVPDNSVSADASLPINKNNNISETVKAIFNLAKTKGLIDDGMDEYESIQRIEQFSGLSLTEDNFTKIIIAITGYVKK